MNWLMKCLINLWRLKVSPINIKQQINLIQNKIHVLKDLKNVQMLNIAKDRIPVYETILKTLKGVEKSAKE
jgi:uncharacterized protein YlaN (UPF0358 family)